MLAQSGIHHLNAKLATWPSLVLKRYSMKLMLRSVVIVRIMSLLLVTSLAVLPLACGGPGDVDESLEAFVTDSGGPPEPRPEDKAMKGKADVIALPAISVAVWAMGAIVVYIAGQEIFKNTIQDFEIVMEMAFGTSEADWEWAEQVGEPQDQAEHLTESLNRIAYRSEGSDFYSVNGNDYLRFLSMTSAIQIQDNETLMDLIHGEVRPLGKFAQQFFGALQVVSAQSRNLAENASGTGLCARATVTSLTEPYEDYIGLARASGPVDIIPAVVLASFRATIRCGMYDTDVRDYVYGYTNVDVLDSIPNTFISQMLKSAGLLYKYVGVCKLPPAIQVTLDQNDCHDVTLY